MKKKLFLFFVLVTLLSVAGFYFLKKPIPTSAAVNQAAEKIGTQPVKKVEAPGYLRAPRTNFKEWVAQATDVPKECAGFIEQLESLDLLQAEAKNFKISYQQLPTWVENCAISNAAFKHALDAFNEKCLKVANAKSDIISDECGTAPFFLRASTTVLLLDKKPLSEVSDLHQLTDLLFFEFFKNSGAQDMPDLTHLKEISARMSEVNPHLYGVAKVANFADSFDALLKTSNHDQAGADAAWAKAEQSLARAKELSPNDPAMIDTEIAIKTHGFDPEKTLAYSETMIEQNPNDGKGYYVKANGLWISGKQGDALAMLKQAIQLDPTNEGYQDTLKKMSGPHPVKDPFAGHYQMGISSGDFDY